MGPLHVSRFWVWSPKSINISLTVIVVIEIFDSPTMGNRTAEEITEFHLHTQEGQDLSGAATAAHLITHKSD